MSIPVIADRKPQKVELEPGTEYYWCRCGRSKNQPYCDGSHTVTDDITPMAFTADKDEAFLCQCKHTSNPPYCDGTHARLTDEDIEASERELQRDAATDEDTDEPAADSGHEPDASPATPAAKPTPEEPHVQWIHEIARTGVKGLGHGPMEAMGVPRTDLPSWDDIQLLTAQLARKPLTDDVDIDTKLVIGPNAQKPLELDIPLFVSDMSFGALSKEAKVSLSRGAEAAGTAIASGEGGMLEDEQAANSRYMFELGSAMFGWNDDIPGQVQAFHFKAGQSTKTGLGGHLPGSKVSAEIASTRGIKEGEDAISPPTFTDLSSVEDFQEFAGKVRDASGGIPIGFKLSAQHIEKDIDFALDVGVDYIILDGRGGGTGASPSFVRDHISVPTIPALARARRHLDNHAKGDGVTLIITGGLRTPPDFVKALALGADGIALANGPIQAVGCIAARICNTNMCPSGVATQDPALRKRIDVDASATKVENYFAATTHLMQMLARVCGHGTLAGFTADDLTSFHREMADLAQIAFAGGQ